MIPLSLEAEEDMANINNDRCPMGRMWQYVGEIPAQTPVVVVDSLW